MVSSNEAICSHPQQPRKQRASRTKNLVSSLPLPRASPSLLIPPVELMALLEQSPRATISPVVETSTRQLTGLIQYQCLTQWRADHAYQVDIRLAMEIKKTCGMMTWEAGGGGVQHVACFGRCHSVMPPTPIRRITAHGSRPSRRSVKDRLLRYSGAWKLGIVMTEQQLGLLEW